MWLSFSHPPRNHLLTNVLVSTANQLTNETVNVKFSGLHFPIGQNADVWRLWRYCSFAHAGQLKTMTSPHFNLTLATFKKQCEQPNEIKSDLNNKSKLSTKNCSVNIAILALLQLNVLLQTITIPQKWFSKRIVLRTENANLTTSQLQHLPNWSKWFLPIHRWRPDWLSPVLGLCPAQASRPCFERSHQTCPSDQGQHIGRYQGNWHRPSPGRAH